MKELTIEEKTIRYDGNYKAYAEIINRLENVKDAIKKQNYGIAMDVLCKPYPEFQITTSTEFAESEDERIRKEIIYHIQNCDDTIDEVTEKRMLAWLERQDEHANFRNKIQIGDKVTRNEDGVLVNLSQLKRVAKSSEEYNITGIGSKHAEGKLGEMIKNLEPVNEVFEQTSPWSEEDEKILNLIIARLHSHPNVKAEEYGKDYHWLKSLKDRVQPQPKQEWGEEDEHNKRQICRILKDNGCSTKLQEKIEKWIEDRLKSLRPQFIWKPSDAQMASITCAVRKMKESACYDSELVSLFNDLKKLKG